MFILIFSNVVLMLFYMSIGFILCKSKKSEVAHAKSLSGLLIYALSPAMLINAFLQLEYSSENLLKIGKFFVITLIVQLLFLLILYIIFSKKYADSKYRILTVGSVLGNIGFLGMPIVVAVFPDEPIVACYSSINVMTMNIIVFTIGVFLITNDKKYVSLKGVIVNPSTISILVALPLFLFSVKLPDNLQNAINILAKSVTPMCMIILGMRLSAAKFKIIFSRPFVYLTCAFKLIVFPVFTFVLVYFLPIDNVMKSCVIILTMVPSGAVIESLAELHECNQELAANVVLLTTILSVLTIPIMATILI